MLLAGGVVAASVGVGVSTPTATYSASVRLAGTTIGVGPSFEGFGLSIPLPFYGGVVPDGDSFHTVAYPAQMTVSIPIISDLPGLSDIPYWPQSLKRSEQIGAGYLLQDIAAAPTGDKLTIIGLSQGTEVAELARTAMAKVPNYVANADNYEFVLIGNPYQPNGGLLTRFTAWKDLPILGDLFPLGRPGPSDSPFKTTYYQNQYDGVVDFPAYFNLLSIANQVPGMLFGHVFPGYVLERPDTANAVVTQVGNTTYVMLPQYLPLLAPLRIPASLIGAERFVDAIDPVLRVFVEMGYDRTADPSLVKEFSWTTPEEKVQEALDALPGAFAQSLAILGGEPYVPTLPAPVVSGAEPSPWIEHPIDPVDDSPWAHAVRHAVEDLTRSLSEATRPLADVFQAIGGATSPQKAAEPDDDRVPVRTTEPEADEAPQADRRSRHTPNRPNAPHTESSKQRLRAVTDAPRSTKPESAGKTTGKTAGKTTHPGGAGTSPQSERSGAASAHSAKPASKTPHTKRDRPSKHKSAHARQR
ncbi:PE-PPE domain-containing protein [Mycobacterium sp. TNTM28]|uniref:PE-PPE domain-containing protein n=2 Tax=[Mycobacterium] fortunisiensis TaxID=2600579 RepID=A0ABS6KSR7_9MYCO|nr:PE-PPE domain-containing protein [[Mycobacterium] fortunisiensis]